MKRVKLAFGSMRMLERGASARKWADFLHRSAELGVTLWHSSDEYESFEFFCEVNRFVHGEISRLSIQHVVKLGEPNFGQQSFDRSRLIARIDSYLKKLEVDCIYGVQWMWRGDLNDDARRLTNALSQEAEIRSTFAQLRQEGKVGAFVPFPYSYKFAEWVLDLPWCDGLTCYLNPIETEMLPLTQVAAARGKIVLALRPLAAGRAVTSHRSAEECFGWTIAQPAVSAGIVSFSSAEHRDPLLRIVG
jgi:aryl-alcohol dehydrogenase-like predicted oxidoreductase